MTIVFEDYTVEIKAKRTPSYAPESQRDKRYNKEALISLLYSLSSILIDAEQGAEKRGHTATARAHGNAWKTVSDTLNELDTRNPFEDFPNLP